MPEPSPLRRSLPNLLTAARLALAAVFITLLSLYRPGPAPDPLLLASAAVFVLAALTDFLDGFLARRWNAVSAFGRVMDPFADKVLVLSAFILLAGPAFARPLHDPPYHASAVLPWVAALILARELLVTSIRSVLESSGRPFPASASGKAKMALQSLAVPVILVTLALHPAPPGSAPRLLILSLVWATLIVTLLSAIPYARRAAAQLAPQP